MKLRVARNTVTAIGARTVDNATLVFAVKANAAARKESQLGAQNAIPTVIVKSVTQVEAIIKAGTNVTRTALVGKENISRVQMMTAQEPASGAPPVTTRTVHPIATRLAKLKQRAPPVRNFQAVTPCQEPVHCAMLASTKQQPRTDSLAARSARTERSGQRIRQAILHAFRAKIKLGSKDTQHRLVPQMSTAASSATMVRKSTLN